MMENRIWAAPAVSRAGASVAGDCLSKYSQTVDGAWYLPLKPAYTSTGPKVGTIDPVTGLVATDDSGQKVNEVVTVADWQACVDRCSADNTCVLVTVRASLGNGCATA
jgi:hypothetical protein